MKRAVEGRAVYVITAEPGDVDPRDTFARWPTAARTLAAVAAAGVEVVGVARTACPSVTVVHAGVEWRFVRDRSRGAWRVAREVRRLRPSVVHMNGTGFSMATVALRVACGRGVRILVQHHGEPPAGGLSRAVQRLVRRAVDAHLFTGGGDQAAPFVAAGVMARSAPVFDVLESSSDVEVVERAEARAATGMRGEPAVVAVGRLVDGKDPLTALRAFCDYASGAPTAELWWLYHDDELEPSLRAALVARPDVARRVHLVGRVERAAMGAWLSGADVFLSASRHEGSGYALIEAICCGCTPVVSDIAPHRAITGPLGARFPVGDAGAATAALSTVRPDREAARDRFASSLTWADVATQTIAAYRAV